MSERRKPVRPWESFESRGTPFENNPTISSISSYLAACYRKRKNKRCIMYKKNNIQHQSMQVPTSIEVLDTYNE